MGWQAVDSGDSELIILRVIIIIIWVTVMHIEFTVYFECFPCIIIIFFNSSTTLLGKCYSSSYFSPV